MLRRALYVAGLFPLNIMFAARKGNSRVEHGERFDWEAIFISETDQSTIIPERRTAGGLQTKRN